MKTSKIITDLATGLLFALLGMGACVSDSGLTDGTGGKKGSGGSYGSGGQTTAHRGWATRPRSRVAAVVAGVAKNRGSARAGVKLARGRGPFAKPSLRRRWSSLEICLS